MEVTHERSNCPHGQTYYCSKCFESLKHIEDRDEWFKMYAGSFTENNVVENQ